MKRRLVLAAGMLVGLAVLVGVFGAYRAWASTPGATARAITLEQLESEYGVRVRLVAVTAGGGMVDFRYKVLDAHKAMQVLKDHSTMPVIVDDSGAAIHGPEGMMHERALETGRTYFLHYPNSAGMVHQGDKVTVVLGGLKLPPITVQ